MLMQYILDRGSGHTKLQTVARDQGLWTPYVPLLFNQHPLMKSESFPVSSDSKWLLFP
jgi:hypothetical protein